MSFIADLIGSFAKAGADAAGDISKENEREREYQMRADLEEKKAIAAERRQSNLAILRAQEMEKNRIKLEDDRAAGKQKRLSDQMADINAAQPTATAERELSQAQSRAPSVDSNVMEILKSKLSPEELKKVYGVDTGQAAKLDDSLAIARKKGYYDAEDHLKAARKETISAMQDEWKRQMEAAKGEREDRKADQTDRKIDIMASRQASGGNGAANAAERNEITRAREKRIDINQQINQILKQADLNMIKPEVAKARIAELEKSLLKYKAIEDGAPAPSAGSKFKFLGKD